MKLLSSISKKDALELLKIIYPFKENIRLSDIREINHYIAIKYQSDNEYFKDVYNAVWLNMDDFSINFIINDRPKDTIIFRAILFLINEGYEIKEQNIKQ